MVKVNKKSTYRVELTKKTSHCKSRAFSLKTPTRKREVQNFKNFPREKPSIQCIFSKTIPPLAEIGTTLRFEIRVRLLPVNGFRSFKEVNIRHLLYLREHRTTAH